MARSMNGWAHGVLAVALAGAMGCQGKPAPAAPPAPAALAAQAAATPVLAGKLDRTVLPIPEPTYPPITELDGRKATPPPRFEVKAPEGAPNVVIILIDDMGFGMSSAFGGPIHMPTVDKLASEGPRCNQFPHHRPILADAGCPTQRSQPPHQQHGLDRGDGHGVPWQYRPAA